MQLNLPLPGFQPTRPDRATREQEMSTFRELQSGLAGIEGG